MKTTSFAVLALALTAGTALAADLPNKKAPLAAPVAVSPWDFQVSGGLTTNYIFRGISQSAGAPSVTAGGELRYNFSDMWQVYAGVSGESIKLNETVPNPSMELDTYGGVRGTFGNFTTDVGVWGYLYPGNTPSAVFPTQLNWYEVYGKLGYNITDWLNVGANLYYTPSYVATNATGTYYSGTFKVTVPKFTDLSISGELGRQALGTTDALHQPGFPVGIAARNLPDYTYYNIGASYAYKFVTFDLRYHNTSLNTVQGQQIAGPTSTSATTNKYCGGAVVGTVSFAFTSKDIK